MFKKEVASKEQVKLMIAFVGTAGSGKTFSALQLAYGITGDWSKIAFVDTEHKSALNYAGAKTGSWEHIPFPSTIPNGYHPSNWIKVIEFAESDPKTEVLILDSISHEWKGAGGCLQLVDQYSKSQKGNTFTPWKIVTPLHDAFIDKMRQSRLHIIATMRAVTEYSMEKNEYGKTSPKKIGLKPEQREGIDYEFSIVFDMDIESKHASASKDRTGLFSNKAPFLTSAEIGKEIMAWAREGKILEDAPKAPEIFSKENEEHLTRIRGYLEKYHTSMSDEERAAFVDMLDGKAIHKSEIDKVLISMSEKGPADGVFE